jgi:hypothetical protein
VTVGLVAIDRIGTGLGSYGVTVILKLVLTTVLRSVRDDVDLRGEFGIAVEVIGDFGSDVPSACGARVVVLGARAVFGVTTADLSVGASTGVTVDVGTGGINRVDRINHGGSVVINYGGGLDAPAGAGPSTYPTIRTLIGLRISGRTRTRDASLGAGRLRATHYLRLD